MTEMEKVIIGMISSAGQSKAKAFEALKKARTGEYDEARALLAEARDADIQAHQIQTKLIQAEMSGSEDKPEVGLLMVHAQDHLMTSLLCIDLAVEFVELYGKVNK